MNFSELKRLPRTELVNIAQEMGVKNPSHMHKQEIIFAYLKARTIKKEVEPIPKRQGQFFSSTPTDDEVLIDRVLSLCSAFPK